MPHKHTPAEKALAKHVRAYSKAAVKARQKYGMSILAHDIEEYPDKIRLRCKNDHEDVYMVKDVTRARRDVLCNRCVWEEKKRSRLVNSPARRALTRVLDEQGYDLIEYLGSNDTILVQSRVAGAEPVEASYSVIMSRNLSKGPMQVIIAPDDRVFIYKGEEPPIVRNNIAARELIMEGHEPKKLVCLYNYANRYFQQAGYKVLNKHVSARKPFAEIFRGELARRGFYISEEGDNPILCKNGHEQFVIPETLLYEVPQCSKCSTGHRNTPSRGATKKKIVDMLDEQGFDLVEFQATSKPVLVRDRVSGERYHVQSPQIYACALRPGPWMYAYSASEDSDFGEAFIYKGEEPPIVKDRDVWELLENGTHYKVEDYNRLKDVARWLYHEKNITPINITVSDRMLGI